MRISDWSSDVCSSDLAVASMQGAISQTPGMGFPITSYQANVPQLDAEVDRVKAKAQGVPLTELFDTLQTYLGSTYVNDFNKFGRTWQVIAQADARFRDDVQDIGNLRTRNDRGEMVPIGSMVKIHETYGPDPVLRYNEIGSVPVWTPVTNAHRV